MMSGGTGLGRLSVWPSTLARLANTGSVQNARESLQGGMRGETEMNERERTRERVNERESVKERESDGETDEGK